MMTIEDAYKIVEEYYEDLYVCETDSNYEGYDLDVASEKKQLERLIASDFKNTEQNKQVLTEILSVSMNQELCDSIRTILESFL